MRWRQNRGIECVCAGCCQGWKRERVCFETRKKILKQSYEMLWRNRLIEVEDISRNTSDSSCRVIS